MGAAIPIASAVRLVGKEISANNQLDRVFLIRLVSSAGQSLGT